ncbi:MAG: transposase [Myxococcales bacterium]|nr:MAG: transposase [Myxococcales bacterium]
MKLCLWGYAMVRGISSAREVARLCTQDLAFVWITAGETIDHSNLSEFRSQHGQALDLLLTAVVGQLQQRLGVSFDGTGREALAQDGTKVRADAAMGSFRRQRGLLDALDQATLHQRAVEANLEPMVSTPRRAGASTLAQVRGARRARHRRVLALVVEKQLTQQRALASDTLERKRPKASTTDPEARVMKMPHGGYEPAYNVQFAAVASPMGGPVAIVGVQVTQTPSDQGSVLPMVDQIEARTGRRVRRLAVDSNHVSQPTLQQAQARGLELISRPPENWKTSKEKKKKPKPTP